MLAIVEAAVRREVDLAMYGDDRTVAHGDRRIEELRRRSFLDQTEYRAHRTGSTSDFGDQRVIAPKRNTQRVGARAVSGQRQLGKYERAHTCGARVVDDVDVLAQVRRDVGAPGGDLRCADVDRVCRVLHAVP